MTVREAIALLGYGEDYYLKGAYSGKTYHKSWDNKKEHLEKYLDENVHEAPFFADLYVPKEKYSASRYARTVIGIWMSDYYICHPEEKEKSDEL